MDGYAIFQDHLGLAQTQRIALDGVGVIGEKNAQIIVQAAHRLQG
jgi:hypothetical protein